MPERDIEHIQCKLLTIQKIQGVQIQFCISFTGTVSEVVDKDMVHEYFHPCVGEAETYYFHDILNQDSMKWIKKKVKNPIKKCWAKKTNRFRT